MDLILIFFIFPLVTIILAAVLEFIIRSPIAVAATFFAIWLLVAYLILEIEVFIIAVTIYTILAFLSAVITRFILNNLSCFCRWRCSCNCNCCNYNSNTNVSDEDMLDESDNSNDNNSNVTNTESNNSNNCCCYRRSNIRRS